MVKPNIKSTLKVHIKAKYSIIALATSEEQRAIRILSEIAAGEPGLHPRQVYIGSTTKGLNLVEGEPEGTPSPDPSALLMAIEAKLVIPKPPPSIFVLLDMHEHIAQNPDFRRRLRDLHPVLKSKSSTIILISPQMDVHSDLQKDITIFDLSLPDKVELEEILCNRIRSLQDQVRKKRDEIAAKPERAAALQKELEGLNPIAERLTNQANDGKDKIVSALQGLGWREADEVLAKCIVSKDLSVETILGEKQQIVRKNGSLDYWQTDESLDSIGGLGNLKRWALSARNRFGEKAAKFGLKPPRGILLVGAPGTGKSLSAKALSNLFNVPLLTLVMANMTSKFYGETGNRMMSALKLAAAMSPAIVLIDEIDKNFGTQGNQEHEESARTRGALLTAMEESEGIIWVATCNQPENLSPELTARFPVMFHVDLPDYKERKEIFTIHLAKIGRDPAGFDLDQLAAASEGYVGREIRNSLQEGLGAAFDQNVEINNDHIITALKKITPTAIQREKEIKAIRKWSETNAQNASDREKKTPATMTVSEEILSRELEV
jgi:SpoVK/Ycf46/Vps4 family AAA+-type ATPase